MQALRTALIVLTLAMGSVAAAQDGTQPSPILTLDQERLFQETAWGKRAARNIEQVSAELAAENRRIETDLTAEEKALTDQRGSMESEAFRTAADAFDAKVTEIRQQQDAKVRAIGRMQEAERQRFFAAVFPVIEEVVRSRGAVVVLDSRAIFLAADAIDVTDDLVLRIDEVIGEGEDVPVSGEPEEAPQPSGETPNGD